MTFAEAELDSTEAIKLFKFLLLTLPESEEDMVDKILQLVFEAHFFSEAVAFTALTLVPLPFKYAIANNKFPSSGADFASSLLRSKKPFGSDP